MIGLSFILIHVEVVFNYIVVITNSSVVSIFMFACLSLALKSYTDDAIIFKVLPLLGLD